MSPELLDTLLQAAGSAAQIGLVVLGVRIWMRGQPCYTCARRHCRRHGPIDAR